MIESIHIINRESGIILFIRSYTNNSINKEIMFVSFLKAIEDISEETKNESIQEIILVESKVVFFKNDHVGVLAITNKLDDSELTRTILEKIGEKFVKKYKKELEFFSGKISTFNDFSEVVDKIIDNCNNLILETPKSSPLTMNPISILKKIGIL